MKLSKAIIIVACIVFQVGPIKTLYGKESISWFKGSIDEAFKMAKKQKRPLFLFWGAVWCPPCNQLKKEVLSQKEIIKLANEYIPVYLDGDSTRAQMWGQKLKATGYPTIILFSSEGNELLRIPGGVSVQKFGELMAKALKRSTPVFEIASKALSGKATREQWKILASHLWSKEDIKNLPERSLASVLKKLVSKIPNGLELEKSRLFMQYFALKMEMDKKRPLKEADFFKSYFNTIISNYDLVLANLESFAFKGSELFEALGFSGSEYKESVKKLLSQTNKVIADSKCSLTQKTISMRPQVELSRSIGKATVEKIKSWSKKADQLAVGPIERQSVIHAVVSLLYLAGQFDEAYFYAKKELKTSGSPFYFMRWLSRIEKKRSNLNESLEWAKRGWENARGRATKLQWGIDYLHLLLDGEKIDEKRVREATKKVFSQASVEEDGFSGRNQMRFDKLAKHFQQKSKHSGGKRVLSILKSESKQICQKAAGQNDCLAWKAKWAFLK